MDLTLKDFNDNVLYPALFESADRALPEFEFKRVGGNWVAGNKRKVTGELGNKEGAVMIYRDRPYYLKDYTREGTAIVTYLIDQGFASDWIGAVKELANRLNLEIPGREISEQERAKYKEAEKKASIHEAANEFFLGQLFNGQSSDKAREYLKGRGFNEDMLRAPNQELNNQSNKAEIGLIPSLEELKEYLKARFTLEDIDKLFMGSLLPMAANRLTIPLRDTIGRIKGFSFRSIGAPEYGPKYLYPKGLDRSSFLFNLGAVRGDKDLVIVEGPLDALHARALGMENIVALGGASLGVDQVKAAQRMGAKKFTFCLDNDPAGHKATPKAIETAKQAAPDLELYVTTLPKGFKDPDELIAKRGIDAFKEVINQAQHHLSFQLNTELSGFTETTDKEGMRLIDSFKKTYASASTKTEADLVLNRYAEKAKEYGITRQSLEQDSEQARAEAEAKREERGLEQVLKEAQALQASGKIKEANQLLGKHGKQSTQGNTGISQDALQAFLKPIDWEGIKKELRLKPESIHTGYKFQRGELLLPAGAITILAAQTSHGKTSFLLNLAIGVTKKNDNIKPIHFFSYEESRSAIALKALNIFSDIDVSRNNRRSIEAYLRDGSHEYFTHGEDHRVALFKETEKDFVDNYLQTGKLKFHYTGHSVGELISTIHALHQAGEVGAVFIDYMQLLRMSGKKPSSRQEELKQICLDLKDCAVETGIPLILGAQFNRKVTRRDKIHATAIGEAGDIERIANLIVGFWNMNFPELNSNDEEVQEEPRPEIHAKILKGRDIGAGDEQTFGFNGNTGKVFQDDVPRINNTSIFGKE